LQSNTAPMQRMPTVKDFNLLPDMGRMTGKNHLFAGSDGGAARWAIVASLLATAKLNDVEPFAYLKDLLERLPKGYPMSRLDDLLPWNWAPSNAAT
jgi:transposase IS66-like protein